jgi:RNA polymerase sigma-70 factor (TIGR02960 family)
MQKMMEPGELIERARAGDGDAFQRLIEPYRRELHAHCYRMLGSFQDAEDALQDSLLAAWRAFAGFEERASLRTWLYRIVTNRCLNLRRSAGRRRAREWDVPTVGLPEPTRRGEVPWLEPYPDGPAARYERTESISLAFVAALQVLPPRQVAVLILRDVLGFPASEVADVLGVTVEAVTSALKRARSRLPAVEDRVARPVEDAVVARFARAYEAADVDALVDLLTDDVFIAMPPMPFEYQGRNVVAAVFAAVFASGPRRLVPARANGQPAFGIYAGGRGTGLIVLGLRGARICALTRFDNRLFREFGLPDQ